MRRHHKTEKEKELIRLSYDYYAVNGWQRGRGWTSKYQDDERGHWLKLDEPYQQGWDRWYILRQDIKNRRDAGVITKLLDMINSEKHCSRQDFLVRDYDAPRKSKKMKPIHQPLESISPAEYRALNEREQSYFSERWECHGGDRVRGIPAVWKHRYVWDYPHFFVFHIEPHIITHRWIPNGDWATREAEIEHRIAIDNLWPKIYKAKSQSTHGYYDHDWFEQLVIMKNGRHKDVIREELDELNNEEAA